MYHAAYNILSVRAEQLDEDELYHHGIFGQKWGVRRYQNEDGSLTPEGKARYGMNENGWVMTKEGENNLKNDWRNKELIKTKEYDYLGDLRTKQWMIEDRYKDYNFMRKQINKDISDGKQKVDVIINKQGQMDITNTRNPEFKKLQEQGYIKVKSLNEIMEYVRVSDIKS